MPKPRLTPETVPTALRACALVAERLDVNTPRKLGELASILLAAAYCTTSPELADELAEGMFNAFYAGLTGELSDELEAELAKAVAELSKPQANPTPSN